MKKLNLIVVFSPNLEKALFCIRAKEPYKGLYNFVGGKVEENESNDNAAYRELFEETGVSNKDIELEHFMDLNYFKYENNLQVYYGILKHEVNLVEKTENGILVSGINCLPQTAYSQMTLTKKAFHKEDGRLGYHIIQSFNGNEISPDKCNKIGMELAEELWGIRFKL